MKAETERRRQMAAQYRARINVVLDYIERHLANEFTLEELAGVAGFSKYHFHRVFNSMTGETLFQFIQRLRLEKGATLLLNEPGKPVTEIAMECGFANSSSFARSFKNYFGVSATGWRNGIPVDRNPGSKDRNSGQAHSNGIAVKPL